MGAAFDLVARIVRWTGLVVGFCFLAIALGFTINTGIFLHNSVAATGTVISLAPKHRGEDNSLNFAPVFTFTTGGQHYTVTADVASNPPEFNVGQRVRVLYKITDPGRARIASFWQLWLFVVAFGTIGTLLSGVGYVLLRYERWRDRRGLSIAAWPAHPNLK